MLFGAAECAGDVDADDDFVAAVGALEVHRVEGGDGLDLAGGDLEDAGDLAHGVRGDEALLVLRRPERREDGAARERIAVAGTLDRGPRRRCNVYGLQCHRSTSPRTMSMEPITATTSAINSPRTMCGSALRLLNDGARTLHR